MTDKCSNDMQAYLFLPRFDSDDAWLYEVPAVIFADGYDTAVKIFVKAMAEDTSIFSIEGERDPHRGDMLKLCDCIESPYRDPKFDIEDLEKFEVFFCSPCAAIEASTVLDAWRACNQARRDKDKARSEANERAELVRLKAKYEST